MSLRSVTIASLLVAVLFSTGSLAEQNTVDCTWYTDATSTSATCNGVSSRVCTGGCTGYVTATECTASQGINNRKPPLTTEKCTVTYGRSSATMAICITEHQTFTCYGTPTGSARCKSCNEPSSKNPTNANGGKANVTANGSNANEHPLDHQADNDHKTEKTPTTTMSLPTSSTPGTTNTLQNSSSPNPETESPNQGSSSQSSTGASLGRNGLSLAFGTLLSLASFFQ